MVVRSLIFAVALMVCLSPALSATIGPFRIAASDSSAVLKLQLAAQWLTSWDSRDKGSGQDRDISLYMKARRIRPTLTLSIPDYRTSFKLHLSAAPGSIELMDFYFDTDVGKKVQVRVGQYKIPFTRYRIQSFQRLTFPEWALVTKYFGAERQTGVSLHNGFETSPRLGWVFGVFSGVNARASHATALATMFGEEVVNPSDLSGSGPKQEVHPEVVGHVSYNANGIDVSSDSDAEGTGLRYTVASSIAWDIDPIPYQDLALRLAQEFLVKYRRVSVMGVGYLGFTDMHGGLRTRLAMSGALVQTAYRATERCEFSARYSYVKTDKAITDAAYARAQAIIAGAADAAIQAQYKDAGKVLAEHEGTVGFNWYLDGHSLKVQNDVGFTRHERRDAGRTDYLVRSQIQLAF